MKCNLIFAGADGPFRESITAALAIHGKFLPAGSYLISVEHAEDTDRLEAHQAQADVGRLFHLPVAFDGPVVWLGPVVPPAGYICGSCLSLWRDRPGACPPTTDTRFELVRTRSPSQLLSWSNILGRHCASLLQSASLYTDRTERRWAMRVSTEAMTAQRHPVVHHPGCERCAVGASPFSVDELEGEVDSDPGSTRTRAVADLASNLDDYYDRKTGLVKLKGAIESAWLPMEGATFIQSQSPRSLQTGIGRTGCWTGSRRVAVLEALERFAGTQTPKGLVRIDAAHGEIPGMIDPLRFVLHDRSQQLEPGYQLAPYNEKSRFSWIKGLSLTTGQEVLLPEQLAFYGDRPDIAGLAGRFVYEISNGCALGATRAEAIYHGILEVIERDSFLCHWYLKRTPPELAIDEGCPLNVRLLQQKVHDAGCELRIFDGSLFQAATTIIVMIRDPNPDGSLASLSLAGCHTNPFKALDGAIVEAVSSFTSRSAILGAEKQDRALAMLNDSSLVQTMDDHMLLYSSEQSTDRLSFLTAGEPISPFSIHFKENIYRASVWSLRDALAAILNELETFGFDVLVASQTNAALRMADLYSVKTLVPGLLPMTFGHQYRRVSRERLATVSGTQDFCINPWPHNFP